MTKKAPSRFKIDGTNDTDWLAKAFDATHGSLALKAYQQNLYLEYYY